MAERDSTPDRGRPGQIRKAPLPSVPTGGRAAISGFLLQILRSAQLGMRLAIDLAGNDDAYSAMRLTLEPAKGGDLGTSTSGRTVVEQVKMRSGSRRWTTREIAKGALADLFRTVSPGGPDVFRFVTDNPAGLEELQEFLAARHGSAGLSPQSNPTDPITKKIAAALETEPDDPRLAVLLDKLEIEILDRSTVNAEIEDAISAMLAPGQDASEKREALTARLLDAASEGRTLDAADLLALIHPEAMLRLQHANALPAALAERAQRDCALLGYDPSLQARLRTFRPAVGISVLSGESGQGKTWSLCQVALDLVEGGHPVAVIRGSGDFESVDRELASRICLDAYDTVLPVAVMARRLRPFLAGGDGIWLTVFIDDVQDRELAEAIAGSDWPALGIRIVVSAQPRIARLFASFPDNVREVRVADFTSSELRRFLGLQSREAPLETMPDDVLEILMKPVHARMFARLPEQTAWTDQTEYELFRSYWQFATLATRDQRDHPGDAPALLELVGGLFRNRPRYPWTAPDLRNAGLSDETALRLEQAGLVRWTDDGRILFSSDRMLNWAVAEYLCERLADGELPPPECEELLENLETITARGEEHLGRRLGYVLYDFLWLLGQEGLTEELAEILTLRMRRRPHDWRNEAAWTKGIASLGECVLPALETVVRALAPDSSPVGVGIYSPLAFAALAQSCQVQVSDLLGRFLASQERALVDLALRSAARTSLPGLVDAVWRIHLERNRAYDEGTREDAQGRDRSRLFHDRNRSLDAIRSTVSSVPEWLDRRIATAGDRFELERLLWLLSNPSCIADEVAGAIWLRRRDLLTERLPASSRALIHALGHFADRDVGSLLDAVPLGPDDWMSSRVLSSKARIDPDAALRQLRNSDEAYGWSTADWWLPELVRSRPGEMSQAIRDKTARSDDPLTEVVLYYANFPELMDGPTLERVLDFLADALAHYNEATGSTGDRLGKLHHPLRFLASLVEPWQFDCLAARRGTALEDELVRLATRRSGRTGRLRDTEGNELERVLAMIGGSGFDKLVAAELARPDRFGREDGYLASRWSESCVVTKALAATREAETDDYRQVVRMEALAVHGLDEAIEEMLRAGTPVYVNATEIRKAVSRSLEPIRTRIGDLLEGSDEDRQVAARLTGFLRNTEDCEVLVDLVLDPDTSPETRRVAIATFNALDFYDPRLLPSCLDLVGDRIDEEAQFVAAYLARRGDSEARAAVAQWLAHRDPGTWSSSHDSFLAPLLDHDESRPAVLGFLRRSQEEGHLLIRGDWLRILAEEGDERAIAELERAAYRAPRFAGGETAAGILLLAERDKSEAFFAARRYLARHGEVTAIDLLLHLDPERALPVLLDRFREAGSALKWEIARRLRAKLPLATREAIDTLAESTIPDDRRIGAELAGWMPPSVQFAWLEAFADDSSTTVRAAARGALASRRREQAGMQHLSAIPQLGKAERWARLAAIFECIDPYFLWERQDPASIAPALKACEPEFRIEARHMRSRRIKKLEDEAGKAEKRK